MTETIGTGVAWDGDREVWRGPVRREDHGNGSYVIYWPGEAQCECGSFIYRWYAPGEEIRTPSGEIENMLLHIAKGETE